MPSLIAVLCVTLFTALPSFVHSQKNLTLRSDVHYGFVLPEYSLFNYLVREPVFSAEVSLCQQSYGKNFWQQLYKYPEGGVTFQFTTLGNKNVFGHELAIYPYFQTPFIRRDQFVLYHQFGVGLGYATQRFNIQRNVQNVAVGSHLNIHFNAKLGIKFSITPQFRIHSGLSFTHYSNANMAEPNLGVNLMTVFAGMNYQFSETPQRLNHTIEPHQRKHELAFMYNIGRKHTRALQSEAYVTSSVSAEYKHHTFRKLHVGGGLDVFYDSSTEIEMNARQKNNYKPFYDFRTGIHLSQELVYDKFSVIIQEGFYVGLTDRVSHSAVYNRAMVRWKFNAHWMGHISMLSHLHILEYPELGFGYYFFKKMS